MAKQYYFPKRIGDQRNWLENYRKEIVTKGPILGMTPAEVDETTDAAYAIIASIDATIAAQNAYKQQVRHKNLMLKANFDGSIRNAVKRLKTSPAFDDGLGKVLGLIGPENTFDPDTFVPSVKVKVFPGEVKLTYIKHGVDGVKIYARTLPTDSSDPEAFDPIAVDHRSPFVDKRPLTKPGQPEVREYYVRGMMHDKEIGLPSAIIRVTISD